MNKDLSYIPQDFDSVKLRLASAEKILEWSSGEITRAETINYRTQKPEHDGLFCEKVFGPVKDWECHCGKYRRIRYKGIVCDRCGVEVTRSNVRRHRMGHIKLIAPVTHIWFLRGGGSSRIAMILGLSINQIERVVYFADYIITKVNDDARNQTFKDMESEYKRKRKTLEAEDIKTKELKEKIKQLEDAYDLAKSELNGLQRMTVISEAEYRNLSIKYGQVFEAGMGAESIQSLLSQIDLKKLQVKLQEDLLGKKTEAPRKKLIRRLMLIDNLTKSGVRPEWMCMNVVPVIPPDLRPMVPLDGGRYATSDLNDLYRRVINRNNRLKKLTDLSAPEVITRNEKRMLQEAVDSLMDNQARKGQAVQASTGQMRLLKSLSDNLKGKQGRFRQNLLGKRVDYSGRSVIVAGPNLKLYECGIPKVMALELFKPFVINKLIERGKAHNVRSASRYIDMGVDDVWAVLEDVIKKKFVLLNRAPTLHRLGIQAFRPVLVEDKAIHLHPLVCTAYNADFDGDQMAVHVPLTKMAEWEAEHLMLSSNNLLKPASGQPIVGPSKEMILGCYYLTKEVKQERKSEEMKLFSGKEEAKTAFDLDEIGLHEMLKVHINEEVFETTVGRIIFNEIFPKNYPFQNRVFTNKAIKIEIKLILDEYGEAAVVTMVDAIKDISYEYATISGNSVAISDLQVPEAREGIIKDADNFVKEVETLHEKGLLTRDERYTKLIEIWTEAKAKLDVAVKDTYPKENPLYDQVASETQGWPVMSLLVGMKGLVADTAGRLIELPIRDNFKRGYDVMEFFTSTHGTRKGYADTALKTSSSGYLTRRMVDVCQEIVVTENDCMDEEGFKIELDASEDAEERFRANLEGMNALKEVKDKKGNTIVEAGGLITSQKVDVILEASIKIIEIRSVLSCKTRYGVCQKCYGVDLGRNNVVELGQAVGIIAAQSLGEPGTQLTMRTRHLGMGKQKAGKDIVQGLPRVDEIMEARNPKNVSIISPVTGKVKVRNSSENKEVKIVEIISTDKRKEDIKFEISEDEIILVDNGDLISQGDQITEGSINLKEMFKEAGFEKTANYIINEIQKIYGSQGEVVSGKHVGILVRQMFSRYKIVDSGDTELVVGDVITHDRLLEANDHVKSLRKQDAKAEQQVLGISAASLATDSFLSAASFMETSKVLIKAAVTGKKDKLKGLKENVIIGKLIPAGTGFRHAKQ